MSEYNICHFIPRRKQDDVINIINFVYETDGNAIKGQKMSTVYVLGIVTEGEALFSVCRKEYKLSRGDIFLVFPSEIYHISPDENFKYMYISYIGIRGALILERCGITKDDPVRSENSELIELWERAMALSSSENTDLLSESVLLYTFSHILAKYARKGIDSEQSDIILPIKKYIDNNLSDTDLSLESIAQEFSYSSKYISALIRKHIGVSFTDYLQTIRVQYACELMENGLSSITDISTLCGFSDPLYFSKVFKKKMGISPTVHLKVLKINKGDL